MQSKAPLFVGAGSLLFLLFTFFAFTQQELSWWAVPFLMMFTVIFGGVFWVSITMIKEDRFAQVATKRFPDQPWLWEKRWQSKEIPARSVNDLWYWLAFTVIVGFFALVSAVQLWNALPDGSVLDLLGLIPIICFGFVVFHLVGAVRSVRLARQARLTLETLPARVGEDFRAQVLMPETVCDLSAQMTFTRVHRISESDGDSFEKRVEKTILADLRTERATGGAQQFTLSAPLPDGTPVTVWHNQEGTGNWELEITCRRGGWPVTLRYPVPVSGQTMQSK